MTVQPQNLFTCDRCGGQEHVQIQNTPTHSRVAGPADWLMLKIGDDPSTPPSHLCKSCAVHFTEFMEELK